MTYLKKALLTGCSIALLAGCSSFEVKPVENLTIEYGDKLLHSTLFDSAASSEGAKVSAVVDFDSKKIGEQDVIVKFTDEKGKKSIEATVKVTVQDSKKPIITLAKDKVEITEGDKLNLKDLVKEVKDPVDGDITYSDTKGDSNVWYLEKEKLDTSKAGTYEIKVVAVDANGNTSEATINITVKEKPVVKVETPVVKESNTQDDTDDDQVIQTPGTQNQHVCKATTLGNTGLLFNSIDEASAYGQGLMHQGTATSYTADAVHCECGTLVGYTVNYSFEVAQKPNDTSKVEEEDDEEPKIIRELGNTGYVGGKDEHVQWAYEVWNDPNSEWHEYDGWESWNVDQLGELWTVNFYKKSK